MRWLAGALHKTHTSFRARFKAAPTGPLGPAFLGSSAGVFSIPDARVDRGAPFGLRAARERWAECILHAPFTPGRVGIVLVLLVIGACRSGFFVRGRGREAAGQLIAETPQLIKNPSSVGFEEFLDANCPSYNDLRQRRETLQLFNHPSCE